MKWSPRWLIGDYVPIESGLNLAERKAILKVVRIRSNRRAGNHQVKRILQRVFGRREWHIAPGLPLNDAARRAVTDDVLREYWPSNRARPIRIFANIGMAIVIMVPAILVAMAQPIWVALPVGAGVFLLGFAMLRMLFLNDFTNLARQELRARGHEICMNCGYYLHALHKSIDHCPECGSKRQPMTED
jgi:hypothetical protein